MTTHPEHAPDQPSIEQQLELAEAEQRLAMPSWRDLVANVFGRGADGFDSRQKAAIAGAPGRRDLFRIGGISVVGAALIAACGTDGPDGPDSATGSSAPGLSPVGGNGTGDMDLVLLRTATSLELAAVAAYQAAIDNADALGITAPVAEAAVLFQSHHAEHAAALQGGTDAAGGIPYEQPNPFFMENVINPAAAALTDEAGTVEFALSLEIAASQTYTFAGGELSTPALRQTIMSIGGVEARHAAVLRGVLGQPQVPFSFNPVTDAAPPESFVSVS